MPAIELPRWLRLATIGVLAALGTTFVRVLVENVAKPQSMDFLSFWAAARLVVLGRPDQAYDVDLHRAVQLTVLDYDGLLPFTYPPHVLALLAPLGTIAYPAALVAWITGGVLLYALVARRLGAGLFPLASPAAFTNVLAGQNGFLLAALFIEAAETTRRRPWLAGLFWALFASKPQLAALVPVALAAGRLWPVFAASALWYLALLAGGALLFGIGIYGAFIASTTRFSGWLLAGQWDWSTLASIYALARGAGVPHLPALGLHLVVAAAGAGCVAWAWRRDMGCKTAVLAAASLLVSPYLFSYDALLLAVPTTWLLTTRPAAAWPVLALWLSTYLIVAHHASIYDGPNPVAPIALLAIILCLRRERALAGRI